MRVGSKEQFFFNFQTYRRTGIQEEGLHPKSRYMTYMANEHGKYGTRRIWGAALARLITGM
jgi:hypothetical protein